MEDYWLDQLNEDLMDVPEPGKLAEDKKAKEQVMRSLSLIFLKIWMRFAIDIGKKMKISPADEDLALYSGKNQWTLHGKFDFSSLSDLMIENHDDKLHQLKVECYRYEGREHVRVIFALEEEMVMGQAIMVNYVVYQSLAKDFSVRDAMEKLKPGLGKWYLALAQNELSILWNFCRDKYEITGV